LPATNELITTGKMEPVADTPMDFTQAKAIGRDIKEAFPDLINGKGYDSCWVIDGVAKDKLTLAAELSHDGVGRKVSIYTTQPGVQVYTGNWLSGCPTGKNGHIYEDYTGVALECQALPDSPNKPNFPNTFLRPGEEYNETIIFKFSNY
jgi:aldose 1-epimerase